MGLICSAETGVKLEPGSRLHISRALSSRRRDIGRCDMHTMPSQKLWLFQSGRTCEACRDSMTVCSAAQLSAGEAVDSFWAAPSLGCSRLTNRAASRGVASQRPSCRGLTKAHVGFCRQDKLSLALCMSSIKTRVSSQKGKR